MRVLVVGSGGREHTLAWALRRSPRVNEVHIAPGNGGTDTVAVNVPIAAEDVPSLVRYARDGAFDLVVIGPEQPLALGLSDALRAHGLRVFGPSQAAARLESSKVFSKDLMRTCGIPTADYAVYTDADAALRYLDAHPAPIVVKASGLAAGKGAIVCQTDEEARSAVRQIMVERAFGAAGDQLVIEEFLTGQEVSVLAFADGRNVAPMILAQDHKAIMDGDRGPNTGGMGAYAPAPVIDRALLDQVVARVLQPTVDALRDAGSPYQGVLYAGLMVDRNAPPERCFRVLEFNCRFGDPEAQAILPLLQTDLVDVLEACIDGRLAEIDLRWAPQSCVCVVMASAGYPGRYASGAEIRIDTAYIDAHPNVTVFHAGTRRDGERLLTAGGRVLGVTAWDVDLPAAIAQAYAAVEHIHWNGALYRRDIGAKGITQS